MPWEFTNDKPVYYQIIDELVLRIVTGMYQPGDKIDSVRDLAASARVNPNTMQKALQELERLGLIYSQRTTGRFVTEDTQLIQQTKDSIAKYEISTFLERMKKLGLTKEDIAEYISRY